MLPDERIVFVPDRDTPRPGGTCGEPHGRVCATQEDHERRIAALETEKRDARGSWRVMAATALGGGLVALVTWLMGRVGG